MLFYLSTFLPSTNDINLIVVYVYTGAGLRNCFKWITTRQAKWELQRARVFTWSGMVSASRVPRSSGRWPAHVSPAAKEMYVWQVEWWRCRWRARTRRVPRPPRAGQPERPRTMLARPCLRYCPTMREMLWQTMTAARPAWYRRPPAIYDILLRDLMTLNVSPLCLRRPSPGPVRIRFRCLK